MGHKRPRAPQRTHESRLECFHTILTARRNIKGASQPNTRLLRRGWALFLHRHPTPNYTTAVLMHTLQISKTMLARFGRWLLKVSATLFDVILGLYTTWMASASKTYTVPCRTLTSIFQDLHVANVSLLKVDVEGAEVAVRHSHPSPSRRSICTALPTNRSTSSACPVRTHAVVTATSPCTL